MIPPAVAKGVSTAQRSQSIASNAQVGKEVHKEDVREAKLPPAKENDRTAGKQSHNMVAKSVCIPEA